MATTKPTPTRKERTGVVTSNACEKTVTVKIERRVKVPLYGKYIRLSKKFAAHDEKNECSVGDTVKIIETRPLSKSKRWRVAHILNKKS